MPKITPQDYAKIPPNVKEGLIQARHLAAIQVHETAMADALQEALSEHPDEPVKNFVITLMHSDEDIMPDEIKQQLKQHNETLPSDDPPVEMWFGVMKREALVRVCLEWEMKNPSPGQDPHCYASAAKTMALWKPEIENSFIVAVFMDGMMSTWPIAFPEELPPPEEEEESGDEEEESENGETDEPSEGSRRERRRKLAAVPQEGVRVKLG